MPCGISFSVLYLPHKNIGQNEPLNLNKIVYNVLYTIYLCDYVRWKEVWRFINLWNLTSISIRVKLRLIQREKITGLENRTLLFSNFLRENDRLLNYQLLPTKKLS